jgi:hypothetical protein
MDGRFLLSCNFIKWGKIVASCGGYHIQNSVENPRNFDGNISVIKVQLGETACVTLCDVV